MRSRSSAAAASVNVIAAMSRRAMPRSRTRLTTRSTSCVVLPVPAPASTKSVSPRPVTLMRWRTSWSASTTVIREQPRPRAPALRRRRWTSRRGSAAPDRPPSPRRARREHAGHTASNSQYLQLLVGAEEDVPLAGHLHEHAVLDAVDDRVQDIAKARLPFARPVVAGEAILWLFGLDHPVETGRLRGAERLASGLGVETELEGGAAHHRVAVGEPGVLVALAGLVVEHEVTAGLVGVDAVGLAPEPNGAAVGEPSVTGRSRLSRRAARPASAAARCATAMFVVGEEERVEHVVKKVALEPPAQRPTGAASCLELVEALVGDRVQPLVPLRRPRLRRAPEPRRRSPR